MGLFSKMLAAIKGDAVPTAPEVPPERKSVVRPASAKATAATCNYRIVDTSLEIDKPHFYGTAYISPSKKWIVGCCDFDGVSIGGSRSKGNGQVVLVNVEKKQIALSIKSIARPFDVAVSDVGSFVIHDAKFGDDLKADVVVFSLNGDELYRRKYKANVFNVGISRCGRYVVAQTCNSPNSPDDSNLLELHNIEKNCVLFSVNPSTDWARAYEFEQSDDQLTKLRVSVDKLGWFTYSTSGEFLDACEYLNAKLEKGDASIRVMAAAELLSTVPSQDSAIKVLRVIDDILLWDSTKDQNWMAKLHRVHGESFELLQRPADAISAYELALSLNAKVGVKKRFDMLRKAAQSGP